MSGSFIDTNIVIYSLSQDEIKQDIAITLLAKKTGGFRANFKWNHQCHEAEAWIWYFVSKKPVIGRISNECAMVLPLNITTLYDGLNLSERYGFSHFDSLIVASALEAGCQRKK